MAETGKVEYAPDYKSEKRKPLNPRVKISAGGRPYIEQKDLVASVLGEGRRIADSVIAANRHNAERDRLRDEIISAARAWYDNEMGDYIEGSPLADAVRALNDFEARGESE